MCQYYDSLNIETVPLKILSYIIEHSYMYRDYCSLRLMIDASIENYYIVHYTDTSYDAHVMYIFDTG